MADSFIDALTLIIVRYLYDGGQQVDPKKIYEMILAGRKNAETELDYDLDVSELLEEFTAVDRAMRELQQAAAEFESESIFASDFRSIDRKMHANKKALEFEELNARFDL